MTDGPFGELVRKLNRTMRYTDMQFRSNEARSSAWWQKVANGERVSPPAPELLPSIAELFDLPPETVAALVVEQWYGIRPPPEVSPRMKRFAALLDVLDDADADLVERLAQRLAQRLAPQQ